MAKKKRGNTAALEKFNRRVKAIKRAHPGISHAAAQQKAKKDAHKTTPHKKNSSPKKRKSVGAVKTKASSSPRRRAVGSVAHTRARLKKQLQEQLAWQLLARDSATKVRDRKKKAKKVAETKRDLRAIGGIGKKRRR